MLLIAGVLCYFAESDVKRLFNDFHTFLPGVEAVFDYFSTIGMKVSNKKVIEDGGMNKSAYLKWRIDNILEIEKWDSNIKVISYMPMYREYKRIFQC